MLILMLVLASLRPGPWPQKILKAILGDRDAAVKVAVVSHRLPVSHLVLGCLAALASASTGVSSTCISASSTSASTSASAMRPPPPAAPRPPQVDPTCAYADAPYATNFHDKMSFAGGINKPKIVRAHYLRVEPACSVSLRCAVPPHCGRGACGVAHRAHSTRSACAP